MVKEEVRRFLIDLRKGLDTEELCELSDRIIKNIKNLDWVKNSRHFMFYYPLKGEPDLLPLAEECLRKGLEVSFPKVEGNSIKPIKVKDLNSFVRGKFGVFEPSRGEEVDVRMLDLIFVPGVGFDRKLYRLGFGKGFYDRFLKVTKAVKVGVAFDFQIFEELPRDEWDMPVDILVTPKEILKRR